MCNTYNHIKPAVCDEQVTNLVALACSGDLEEWQLVSLISKVAGLPAQQRTDFWIGVRAELSEPLYNELHRFYLRYCLEHRWGRN